MVRYRTGIFGMNLWFSLPVRLTIKQDCSAYSVGSILSSLTTAVLIYLYYYPTSLLVLVAAWSKT
jgi:hypothetical protein